MSGDISRSETNAFADWFAGPQGVERRGGMSGTSKVSAVNVDWTMLSRRGNQKRLSGIVPLARTVSF